MIRAYDELYLSAAQECLGCLLEAGVYGFGMPLDEVFNLLIRSGYARRFETGDCTVVAGKSGHELLLDLLWETGSFCEGQPTGAQQTDGRSHEYWLGSALAYYQWAHALPFARIVENVPLDMLLSLYHPYHEMDVRQFVDRVDELKAQRERATALKRLRLQASLSQSDLAKRSGVPVRTIQQYEQRQKSIDRAGAGTVFALSRALGCTMENLLEHEG